MEGGHWVGGEKKDWGEGIGRSRREKGNIELRGQQRILANKYLASLTQYLYYYFSSPIDVSACPRLKAIAPRDADVPKVQGPFSKAYSQWAG